MMNFRQIEVFRAVMIAKTVSGASRLMNVSQPGLSRMLRHTEDKLGFALFDRVSGRLVPTREAVELFAEIESIYNRIEDLDLHISRLQRGGDTIFRVGAQPSVGQFVVPRALGSIKSKFENLTIQFDILSLHQVADYLVRGEGEYVVGVFAVDHPNVISRECGSAPLVCILPFGHPLAGKKELQVRDIAGEALISFRSDTPHGAVIDSVFEEAGVERKVSTYVRFAGTTCTFVRNGLGIGIVDGFTILGDTCDGMVIRPLSPVSTMPLFIHRNKFAGRSLIAKSFESEVEAVAAEIWPRLSALFER